MSKTKRQRYSPGLKAKIALEAIKGDKSGTHPTFFRKLTHSGFIISSDFGT